MVTEEESEFVAHRSPELEAAEAKAVRDAADAMAAAATATAASVLEAVTKGVAQEVAALQAREPQGATARPKRLLPPTPIRLRLILLRWPRLPRAPWPSARSWAPRRRRRPPPLRHQRPKSRTLLAPTTVAPSCRPPW